MPGESNGIGLETIERITELAGWTMLRAGTDGKLLGQVNDGNLSNFSKIGLCANRKMTSSGRNLVKCATSQRKIQTD